MMDDKEQFTNLVAKHASGLTEEQLAGYDACSLDGECVTPSYEVFRGYRTRHTLDEFLEMAISLNAIHPDEYLTDMLLKPHEVIGALADEGDQLNNATRFISFRIPASMQRPLVKPGCSMPGFAGHATRRTGNAAVGIAPAGYEFNRPVAGRLSELHVLIPQAPCQAPTCCQASPDSRSAPILQPITFCFLFIFFPFPQKSRAAWTGHHCRMWGLNKGRVVSFARCQG
uniref:hypothetical protein n=1 Tax=Salmonella enterica TaxID=28901 RepID=UPI001F2B7EB3|nr:hypothetical protein [Salmonella enterica]